MPQDALLKNKSGQFKNLNFSGVIATFSRRIDGNMSLKYGETRDALNNRKNFLQNLGIDYRNLVCAKQIHSSNIEYVTSQYIGKGALSYNTAIDNTDALITDKKNIPLAIFTADCLSIFLYDPQTRSIGLAHAGWRSSRENIVTEIIKSMKEKFNSDSGNLLVAFGPAIRECCYKVREDFKKIFPGQVTERSGRYYLDLVALNQRQVLDTGVPGQNLFDAGLCTCCLKENLFSFRCEGLSCGRMMSVMMLK